MSRAVGRAIRAAKTLPLDAGTVALTNQYAELIDNAVPLAKYVKHLEALREAVRLGEQYDPLVFGVYRDHLDKVIEALSAHSVASDLGPKLLAALTALGLTPQARRAVMGGQNGVPTSSGVDQLKKRRADRAARAG